MERKSSADGEDNEVRLAFVCLKSGGVFPVAGGGVSVPPTGGIDGQR